MSKNTDELLESFGGIDATGFADADLQFTNCRFGQSADYTATDSDGATYHPLMFMTDLVNGDGEVREDQLYTIGKGFQTDDGTSVTHDNPRFNKKAGFGNGTKMQTILDSAVEHNPEALVGRAQSTGLSPRDAGFWEGFSFHGVEEERKFMRSGKEQTYKALVITDVYGFDGLPTDEDAEEAPAPAKKAAKKAPAKKAAAKPAPPKPAPKADAKAEGDGEATIPNSFGIPDNAFIELVALIEAADADFDGGPFYSFIEAAYETEWINDDDIRTVIDNEADDGLFATVWAAKS